MRYDEHDGAAGHYDDWHTQRWRYGDVQQEDSLLSSAVKGAIAGLAATAIVSAGMQVGPKLLERSGALPEGITDGEQPTEKLAETVAERAFDTQLSDGMKMAAGQAVHRGYGTFWGAVYGLAQRELDLTPPPTEQPLVMNAFMGGINLVYGEAVAIVYDMLS